MTEVVEEAGALQLQTRGVYQGRNFTLVGQRQYRYPHSICTEWHAVLEDGSSAFLSEEGDGSYVMVQAADVGQTLAGADSWWPGRVHIFKGTSFSVVCNEQVLLHSTQGDLPHVPSLDTAFALVELRSTDRQVLTIDYSPTASGQPPMCAWGRLLSRDDLQLTGLRDVSETKKERSFKCPHCSSSVTMRWLNSKSVSCRACYSLINTAQGTQGALSYTLQSTPHQFLISLGSTGQLQGLSWQVIGVRSRFGYVKNLWALSIMDKIYDWWMGRLEEGFRTQYNLYWGWLSGYREKREPDTRDITNSGPFGWDEYLLYNRKRGVLRLLDIQDGWRLVQATADTPSRKDDNKTVQYLDKNYHLLRCYQSTTTSASGEFDFLISLKTSSPRSEFFTSLGHLLIQEAEADQVHWLSGKTLDGRVVAQAFGHDASAGIFERSAPHSLNPSLRDANRIWAVIPIIYLLIGIAWLVAFLSLG